MVSSTFTDLAPIAVPEGQRPINKPAQGKTLGIAPLPMRAMKGRRKTSRWVRRFVAPLHGSFFFCANTQGGARASLALGWLVAGLWPIDKAFPLHWQFTFTSPVTAFISSEPALSSP